MNRLDPEELGPSEDLRIERRPEVTRCRGRCKGQRSNTESPAKVISIWSHGQAKKIVMCECCEQALRYDPTKGAPAINPRLIEGKHKRFTCPDCGYNVVLLAQLA